MKIILFCLVMSLIKQRVTSDEYIYCWATCDLANCGSNVVKNDSFVNCTWKPTSAIFSEFDYNMSLILRGGESNARCNVKAECDKLLQTCETVFHKKNCDLIARHNGWMHLRVHDSQRIWAQKSNFKICDIGKADPPGIKVTQKRNRIKIISRVKSCIGSRIEYRLNYTYSKEDGKVQADSLIWSYRASGSIDLVNEAEYNFTLESTKAHIMGNDKVYSDPSVYQNFVTSPDTAFDGLHFAVECDEIFPGRIMAKWKKSGKIDFFEISLIDGEKDQLVNLTRVYKTSPHQKIFQFQIDDLNSTWQNYTITLVASNKGGKSPPSRQKILRAHCKNIPEIPCTVSNIDSSYFDLKWKTDSAEILLILISSNGTEVLRKIVTAESGFFRQMGVNRCQRYRVSISILRGKNEFVSCTKEVVPTDIDDPPLIRLIKIGARNVDFQAGNNVGGCNYSETFWWRIHDREWVKGHFGKTTRVESLKPNTKYRIEVKMDSSRDSRIRSMILETTESGNISTAQLHNHTEQEVQKGVPCFDIDCKTGSASIDMNIQPGNTFSPMIILSICCGALILTVSLIGCLHHIRKKHLTTTKPRLHPDLQKQFDEAFTRFCLENNDVNTEQNAESPSRIHQIGDEALSNFLHG